MHSVLLIDDEIFARTGLRNLIDWHACGFEVVGEADNGEDGFEMIERLKPELVITDIRMPVVDGLELIRMTIEKDTHKPGFIIISGYNDFSYAQQAVRYGVHDFILKPIDEVMLQDTLIKLNHKLSADKITQRKREEQQKTECIAKLIKGEIESEETLFQVAETLGLQTEERVIYVFIEVNDRFPWSASSHMSYEALNAQLKSGIAGFVQSFTNGNVELNFYEHRNRLGWLLPLSVVESRQTELSRFIRELQIRLTRDTGQVIYLYAGKVVKSLKALRESFESAKDSLQYKYLNEREQIVLYEDIKKFPLNYVDMEAELYTKLTNYVEENHESGVNKTINEIFDSFTKRRCAPEAVKVTIHRCVSNIIRIMERMEVDFRSLPSLGPILTWQDLNISFLALKNLFQAFITDSMKAIGTQRKETSKGGIHKIKCYIEDHYRENISLKSIAAHFYMNPVYLGQLFKKTYGLYFNDYLLRLRIEEAKRLLRQTDMRIYEVADAVGFSNADYFVTQFEKLEDMTPTEYRNKLLHHS
ncbi:DNA-binding response regulator [Xylanibacillus composti]|uniref:AraC family transcriptional regulator n=1 Tax=Xylanibacillus composti TaxID=1572762 RepID=A0A8J4H5J9_9BACL|nr:response regulator transcription factor [Xylanibacillus composti]MDT9727091.1 DNA-binding response regulator [Xylanibacillus composti]GIQ68898.1 AraC family transcriptional regulator [Xylanibacillus composti]